MRKIIRESQTMIALNLKETAGLCNHWPMKELKHGQTYSMRDGNNAFIEP